VLEILLLLEHFGLPYERGSLEMALWLAVLNGMVEVPGGSGRPLNTVVSSSPEAAKKRRQRSNPKRLEDRWDRLLQNFKSSGAADESKLHRMGEIFGELSARAAERDKILG
jgi:hypothetical protein